MLVDLYFRQGKKRSLFEATVTGVAPTHLILFLPRRDRRCVCQLSDDVRLPLNAWSHLGLYIVACLSVYLQYGKLAS